MSDINLSEKIPTPPSLSRDYPFYSPKWAAVVMHESVPRYFYHVGKASKGGGIKSYKIRETEVADTFGKGYADNTYIWLSQKPVFRQDYYIVDITKLNNADMRFTGQVEGHLLHKGDIPAHAIVGRHGKVIERDE